MCIRSISHSDFEGIKIKKFSVKSWFGDDGTVVSNGKGIWNRTVKNILIYEIFSKMHFSIYYLPVQTKLEVQVHFGICIMCKNLNNVWTNGSIFKYRDIINILFYFRWIIIDVLNIYVNCGCCGQDRTSRIWRRKKYVFSFDGKKLLILELS